MFAINKIKLSLIALVAAFSISSGASNQAFAHAKDIVIDSNGHHVLDSFGGCVRTMWDEPTDKCKKMIDVMKMDERIIYFAFDNSMLDKEEQMKLDKLSQILSENEITRVKIVGYTDKIGTNEYNQKLSEKRAHSVKTYLDNKVHLDSSPVEVRALGENNPVVSCKGVKGKEAIKCLAPNRRVEVEVDYYDMVR